MPDQPANQTVPKLVRLARPVVLASGSPYRRALLEEAHVVFTVDVADIDESLYPNAEPAEFATGLALRKAMAVAARHPGAIVIGADTVCAIGDRIIGKPKDSEDAFRMIREACDSKVQRVITGVALVDAESMKAETGAVTSMVEMRNPSDALIRAYVATGEPMGKCGALCIEGDHGFVAKWEGSYSNIMGLPLEWVVPRLARLAGEAQAAKA